MIKKYLDIDSKYETTEWRTKAYVSNKEETTLAFIDTMRCHGSGELIEEHFLRVFKTNDSHRGTETDRLFLFNKEATPVRYLHLWEGKARLDCPFDVEVYKEFGTCDCGKADYKRCLNEIKV